MDTEAFEITVASRVRQAKLMVSMAAIGLAADAPQLKRLADAESHLEALAVDAEEYAREIRDRRWRARSAALARIPRIRFGSASRSRHKP